MRGASSRLEYVQLRELTRQSETADRGAARRWPTSSDCVENLARRFDAHERGHFDVYYPAAAQALEASECVELEIAARGL